MNGSDLYIVKVKNGAGWRAFDNARLQISVGQEYHEGEKFLATLQWAGERFKKVTICVNDTLQRHNLEFEGSAPETAYMLSEEAGRCWIERNIGNISKLPNYEMTRWEQWRTDAAYSYGLETMERLYRQNKAFRMEVNLEIDAFWDRALRRGNAPKISKREKFQKHSLSYLLEECAIFQLMFAKETAVDIYPGSTLLPCKINASGNLGTRGYTRIDFRRKIA